MVVVRPSSPLFPTVLRTVDENCEVAGLDHQPFREQWMKTVRWQAWIARDHVKVIHNSHVWVQWARRAWFQLVPCYSLQFVAVQVDHFQEQKPCDIKIKVKITKKWEGVGGHETWVVGEGGRDLWE